MIKVGLLGFNFMGRMHFKIHQGIPDVKVVGIYDRNPEDIKKKQVAGNIGDSSSDIDLTGIKLTNNPEELLDNPDIDVIDICLPTFLHCEYAVKAMKKGKHVLCEKPMALTSKEADIMLKAAKNIKKKFMIAQCIRFWPEYAYAKEAISKNRYGKVISAYFKRVSPMVTWSCNNWIMDSSKSGGALLDLHIHDIDYVVYLFGKPKKVVSSGLRNKINPNSGIDYIVTSYKYSNNMLVMAEGGWHYHPKFPFNMSYTIRCEKATIAFDISQQKPLAVYDRDGGADYPEVPKSNGWEEEIKYFIDCVKNDRPIKISTPEESRLAVKIAEAEEKSVRIGK